MCYRESRSEIMKCIICGNETDNQLVSAKEMNFGFRDVFSYVECSSCHCLQISEIPENMMKYYSASYYSFQEPRRLSKFEKFLRRRRDRYELFGESIIGFLAHLIIKSPSIASMGAKYTGIRLDSTILDVGCGSGSLLESLYDVGLRHVTGIDPLIKTDILGDYSIFKKSIDDLPASPMYDIIIFNHSLEHIQNQLETLQKARKLLSASGILIVRIPIKSEYIWARYGTNWVQLDAPRHLFLHTLLSFEILTKKSGLRIRNTVFDSNEFQFWGSEQYIRNIPLNSEKSWLVNKKQSIFSRNQIADFKRQARILNSVREGDQATFYLENYDSL